MRVMGRGYQSLCRDMFSCLYEQASDVWVVIEDACEHVFVPIQFIVTVIHTTWRSEYVRAALQTFNLTYLSPITHFRRRAIPWGRDD